MININLKGLFMIHKYIIVIFSVILFVSESCANVTMLGTRIIYLSSLKEKIIQFNNPDDKTYIIQINMSSEDDAKPVPFVVVPPVFRMEPHSGQSVRLIYNDSESLPQDRESIFYLSFTQFPTTKKDQVDLNQLVFAITSKIKLFYRPVSLVGSEFTAYKLLEFKLNQGEVTAYNPSGYFINMASATIVMNGQEIKIADNIMIAPFASVQLKPQKKITSLKGALLKLTIVNDYGAYFNDEKKL